VTRAEKVAEAQRLRVEGLKLREISERMGVAISTVQDYISDPDLSKHMERRRRYGGKCVDCGKGTDGSRGAAERCLACSQRHRHEARKWTSKRIVEAIREFAERYGRPPAAADWNPPRARATGHHDRALRFEQDGCWPWATTVVDEFGTWNAAIVAAGFASRGPGQYPRDRGRGAHLNAERPAA
jgi:transposase